MYAVVKVDGKQHRVEEGDTLLVDRMPEKEGAKIVLTPLLYRADEAVFDSDSLKKVKVEAVVLSHERGPKLRIVKFKPKSGYKRHTGHRSELTRIEVKAISFAGKAGAAKTETAAKKADAAPKAEKAEAAPKVEKTDAAPKAAKADAAPSAAKTETAAKTAAKTEATPKPKSEAKAPATPKPKAEKPKTEDSDGA